jgi:hypothetical protein
MKRLTRKRIAGVALVLVPLWGVCGCDEGSPAAPVFEAGLNELASDAGGDGGPMYVVCLPGLDASFGSLYTQMFSTSSCGTDRPLNCHSGSGASPRGTGNLLDFEAGAAQVYAELLGPDGGGHRSTNLAGSLTHVLRVVPGDASASMLYIKLMLTTSADPQYGAGMPLDYPGSVCPATIDAVKTWINEGAAQN